MRITNFTFYGRKCSGRFVPGVSGAGDCPGIGLVDRTATGAPLLHQGRRLDRGCRVVGQHEVVIGSASRVLSGERQGFAARDWQG